MRRFHVSLDPLQPPLRAPACTSGAGAPAHAQAIAQANPATAAKPPIAISL